jgi:hypothetical protein
MDPPPSGPPPTHRQHTAPEGDCQDIGYREPPLPAWLRCGHSPSPPRITAMGLGVPAQRAPGHTGLPRFSCSWAPAPRHAPCSLLKIGTDTIFRGQGNQGLVRQSLVSLMHRERGGPLPAKNGCLSHFHPPGCRPADVSACPMLSPGFVCCLIGRRDRTLRNPGATGPRAHRHGRLKAPPPAPPQR